MVLESACPFYGGGYGGGYYGGYYGPYYGGYPYYYGGCYPSTARSIRPGPGRRSAGSRLRSARAQRCLLAAGPSADLFRAAFAGADLLSAVGSAFLSAAVELGSAAAGSVAIGGQAGNVHWREESQAGVPRRLGRRICPKIST